MVREKSRNSSTAARSTSKQFAHGKERSSDSTCVQRGLIDATERTPLERSPALVLFSAKLNQFPGIHALVDTLLVMLNARLCVRVLAANAFTAPKARLPVSTCNGHYFQSIHVLFLSFVAHFPPQNRRRHALLSDEGFLQTAPFSSQRQPLLRPQEPEVKPSTSSSVLEGIDDIVMMPDLRSGRSRWSLLLRMDCLTTLD